MGDLQNDVEDLKAVVNQIGEALVNQTRITEEMAEQVLSYFLVLLIFLDLSAASRKHCFEIATWSVLSSRRSIWWRLNFLSETSFLQV